MKPIASIALLLCLVSFSAMAEESPKVLPQPAAEPPKILQPAPELLKTAEPPKLAEPSQAQQPMKIGYVDLSKIATDSAPGKAASAKMKERTEKYRSQITARQKKLENMKKDIEAKLPSLTPQQRQAKVKELEKKVGEYQKYVQDAEKAMRKTEGELTESMSKAIQKAADDYGKANGFAVIVPKRDLLYLGDKVDVKDVTEDILKSIR